VGECRHTAGSRATVQQLPGSSDSRAVRPPLAFLHQQQEVLVMDIWRQIVAVGMVLFVVALLTVVGTPGYGTIGQVAVLW